MTDLVNSESGKGTAAPTIEQDAGLFYPASYAISTWVAYRHHGIMPEAGAYNDQCEQWRRDIGTLNQRYNLAVWELGDGQPFGGQRPLVDTGATGDDWQSAFGS